jgi:RHS repeat-associated protein
LVGLLNYANIFTQMTIVRANTGLFYYGARHYDAKISVWLSVDPLSSNDPNLTPYHFVKNNPVNLVDPNGLTSYKVESDGNIEKSDDKRYAQDNNGNVRMVSADYEMKESERSVNKFTGTNKNTGEEQTEYLQVKKMNSDKVSFKNAYTKQNKEEDRDNFVSGTHDDAVNFIGLMADVTNSEFSYNYSKTGDTEYFGIGTLRNGGYSSSKQRGQELKYNLHNHPGSTPPSREDAHSALSRPNTRYDVLSRGEFIDTFLSIVAAPVPCHMIHLEKLHPFVMVNRIFALLMLLVFFSNAQTTKQVEYPILQLEEPNLKKYFTNIIDSIKCVDLDTSHPTYVLSVYVSVQEMNFNTNEVEAIFNFEVVPSEISAQVQKNYAGVLIFENGYVFVNFSTNYFWVKSTDGIISFPVEMLDSMVPTENTSNNISYSIACAYKLEGNQLRRISGCDCN